MGRNPIQVIVVALICAFCIYLVFKVAANWADWVVFGMIVVTAFGAAIAVYPRRYPAQKRAYTRRSDDKFRRR
jgi:protein-S-isoprenylcysteine O-methyltransferase Ste14